MKIALVGDIMASFSFEVAADDSFMKVASEISECDIALGNLETVLHDYQFPPAAESGGSWMRCPPSVAGSLKEIGFSMLSLANNHAGDWGVAGMEITKRNLEKSGILYAGVGRDQDESFSPAVLSSSQGAVSLISMTTTSPIHATSGFPKIGSPGRPGVAFVPIYETLEVPVEEFQSLVRIANKFSGSKESRYVDIADYRFIPGNEFRRHSYCDTESLDLAISNTRSAAAASDVVVASIHSHQHGDQADSPSAGLVELARGLVEAGARIVFCHGSHKIRGIELLGRSVIFYSLGNFIFQPSGISGQHEVDWGSDMGYWKSAIAFVDVENDSISIKMKPIAISNLKESSRYGLPGFVFSENSTSELENLSALAAKFGVSVGRNGEVVPAQSSI